MHDAEEVKLLAITIHLKKASQFKQVKHFTINSFSAGYDSMPQKFFRGIPKHDDISLQL